MNHSIRTPEQQAEDTRREKIIEQIRKLAKMTTENGCSESEAGFAAERISKLRDEYDINETELTLKADATGCILDEFIDLRSGKGTWTSVCKSIMTLFHCRHYYEKRTESILGLSNDVFVVKIFGFPGDVTSALALTGVCYSAIVRGAITQFPSPATMPRKQNGKVFREYQLEMARIDQQRQDFSLGMAHRLSERIDEMVRALPAKGTGLISLKNQLVTDEWKKLLEGLNLRPSAGHSIGNRGAYEAGRAHANSVDIGSRAAFGNSRPAIGNK